MTLLSLFTPSGVVARPASLRLAERRLRAMGLEVQRDTGALARSQRFGGDDDVRLEALHRVARQAPAIAMATRGGYGLTRLLDRIDWRLLARSVAQGTRWVGHSDFTALHLGLLAHGKAAPGGAVVSWAGPMACTDFGRESGDDGADAVDDVTQACFLEAMSGELEAVGFRTEEGFDGVQTQGLLWGGNLTMLCSLLGTPHWPRIKGGVLFLEDVGEHPYRIERMLLQLHQAGVLGDQKAVLLGSFTDYTKQSHDRGYTIKSAVQHLRGLTRAPILTGLPFGHVPTKVCLPVGARVRLVVQGRDVLLGWHD
jgi:muramoyltetrapeptide carboxypeptidase